MPSVKSTTERGDEFRDAIAELLRTSGHNVISEALIEHKKVDILASFTHLGRTIKFIVEAKTMKSH